MASGSGAGDILDKAVLELGLHKCDENIISAYFQRASLFSFGVHPMLLCCATLESMVRGIVKHTQTGHYREAVCLLEYIHSRFPSVGTEEQYVNLLVDIKTKAVLYELFQELVMTDEKIEQVLCKYFGQASEQETVPIHAHCSTTEDYYSSLHAYARRELVEMLASKERCQWFQSTHLFSSSGSRIIHSNMLTCLDHYLTAVRSQLPQPLLGKLLEQTRSSHGDHPNTTAAVPTESIRDFSIAVPKLNCPVGIIKGLSGPAHRHEDKGRDTAVNSQDSQANSWRNRLRHRKKMVTDDAYVPTTSDDMDSESFEKEDDVGEATGRGRGRGKGKRRVRQRRRVVQWMVDSSDDTTETEDSSDSSEYRKKPRKKIRPRFSTSPLAVKGREKHISEKPTTAWHSTRLEVGSYATPLRTSRHQKLRGDIGKHSTVQALISPHRVRRSRAEGTPPQTRHSVAAFKPTAHTEAVLGSVKVERSSDVGGDFSDTEQAKSRSEASKNSHYLLRSHKWSQAVSSISSSPISGVPSAREHQLEHTPQWQRKRKRLLRMDTSESDTESQSTVSDTRAVRPTRSRVSHYNQKKRQRVSTESEESNTEHAMKEPPMTTESDWSSTDRLRVRKPTTVGVAERCSDRHAVKRSKRLTDSKDSRDESTQLIAVQKRQTRQTAEPRKNYGRSTEISSNSEWDAGRQTTTERSEINSSMDRATTHHRRRKQETPMRKVGGEKVEAAVQFMHMKQKNVQQKKYSHKEALTHSLAKAVRAQAFDSGGSAAAKTTTSSHSSAKSHRVKKRGASSQGQGRRKGETAGSDRHSADLSSSSSSPSLPSHMLAPVRSSGEVVDLAGEHIELTQPASQWDYVAVEAIAASEVVPAVSDSTAGNSPIARTPLESIRSIRRPRI